MKYVLTENGIKYITRVNSQIINMRLLRAEVGNEISETPEILTEIKNKKQRLQIDEITAEGDVATVHCTLTNLETHEEYILRQIGIFAWDSDRGREELIIVGQDTEGDRIPAIEEREVMYLYNIGIKVSNTEQITFDSDTNDFLRKKYFYEHLREMEKRNSVRIGPIDTVLNNSELLFVVDTAERPETGTFAEARITNMPLQNVVSGNGDNIGQVRVVEGKLKVAEAENDTKFLAQT